MLTVFRNGNVKQRQWATDWLADRGFGRPVQFTTIREEDVTNLCERLADAARSVLSPEDFERVAAAWSEVGEQLKQEW